MDVPLILSIVFIVYALIIYFLGGSGSGSSSGGGSGCGGSCGGCGGGE